MRYLFFVQGEGRGHMTQAIALKQILSAAGHEVIGVIIGKSPERQIPDFFYQKIATPVWAVASPNFVKNKNGKGVNLGRSLLFNLRLSKNYRQSLKFIEQKITALQPDLIINFFEPLVGIHYARTKPQIPLICIGHQYFSEHPKFKYPGHKFGQFLGMRLFTRMTSCRATLKLALSFRPWDDQAKKNLYIVPPLLRQEVYGLKPEDHNFILVYLLNHGFIADIIAWHQKHPQTKIIIFCDQYKPEWHSDENLILQPINDVKFLEALRTCSGFLSTAGFESLCEANYLGKPVLAVPSQKHFEQACNALDLSRSGLGLTGTSFDLDVFLKYLKEQKNCPTDFRIWVDSSAPKIIALLEKLGE
jgi:uncharacterized protein (TIGR00661 family)